VWLNNLLFDAAENNLGMVRYQSYLFLLYCKKELQASSYKLQAYDRVSRSEQREASSLKLEAKLKKGL
jgi:hypothetical protein